MPLIRQRPFIGVASVFLPGKVDAVLAPVAEFLKITGGAGTRTAVLPMVRGGTGERNRPVFLCIGCHRNAYLLPESTFQIHDLPASIKTPCFAAFRIHFLPPMNLKSISTLFLLVTNNKGHPEAFAEGSFHELLNSDILQ